MALYRVTLLGDDRKEQEHGYYIQMNSRHGFNKDKRLSSVQAFQERARQFLQLLLLTTSIVNTLAILLLALRISTAISDSSSSRRLKIYSRAFLSSLLRSALPFLNALRHFINAIAASEPGHHLTRLKKPCI